MCSGAGRAHQRHVGAPGRQLEQHGQPGRAVGDAGRAQAGQQRIAPLQVQALHAPQVAQVVAASQQFGHSLLHERRRRAAAQGGGGIETGDLVGRHHQEAQAQRRADGLAEGAHVQHARCGDIGPESGRGAALQLQFAEVIVFEHPGLLADGPVEQRAAPRQGQRPAQRRLLARRDHGQRGLRRQRLAGGHVQALRVHGHGHGGQAQRGQQLARERVAGLLSPGLARQTQGPHGEHGGDLRAQRGLAARIGVVRRGTGGRARSAHEQARPELGRDAVLRRHAHLEHAIAAHEPGQRARRGRGR